MQKKKLTFFDLMITLVLSGALIFAAVNHFFFSKNENSVLIVETDKEKYFYKIDSGKKIEIKTDSGTVEIEILKNKFRFSHSTCPNKDCVKIGWVSLSNFPVICLPNKVTAYITGDEEEEQYDGISR